MPGDVVYLIREPGNPYDANAIAVHNAQGHRIGFVPRQQAAVMAPYIDSLPVSLSGRLLTPGEAGYDEDVARTRPPFMIYVFLNPAVVETIPAATAVTCHYSQSRLGVRPMTTTIRMRGRFDAAIV